jgi:hypothetical protein
MSQAKSLSPEEILPSLSPEDILGGQTKTSEQPGVMSRLGTGIYNTTIGPTVQTAQQVLTSQHPLDTLSNIVGNIAGVPQYQEAWNQAKQGHYLPAAISLHQAVDPSERMGSAVMEPIAQNIKSGNYAGAIGQVIGLGASFAIPELAGRLGGAKLGSSIGAGLKAAAPDVAMGGLKTGTGVGVGAVGKSMGVPSIVDYLVGAEMSRPGLRQIGAGLQKGARAFGDAWKGPVKPPGPEPPPIPTKGPSIGDLKAAVKNGAMTPEQFDASIDKMPDLTLEAKNLHKTNVRASQATPVKFPVTSPKTLNLGQLQKSVGSGRMSIEEYTENLKGLGYTEEHASELTEQLKDSLKEEKEAEAAKEAKSSPETKKTKNKTKAPEVKVNPPSQAPQMKVEPPGVPQTGPFKVEEVTHYPKLPPLEQAPKVEAPKVETPKSSLGEVEPPKTRRSPDRPYEDPDNPLYRGKITEAQIEESQSIDKLAKETRLSRYLDDKKIDLDSIPKTSEYLKAISQEAGLKRVASLQTLEGAIKRAREMKVKPSKPQ